MPFSKAVFIAGEPIFVARDSDADTMEAKRLELENTLNDLTTRADKFFN